MPGVSSDEPHDESAPPVQSKCQPAGLHQVLLLGCWYEHIWMAQLLPRWHTWEKSRESALQTSRRGCWRGESRSAGAVMSWTNHGGHGEPTTLHELHLLLHNLQLTSDRNCKHCYWKHEMTAFGPTTVLVPSATQWFHQVHIFPPTAL